MLALVVAVALSQCTKDTDCKGERVCVDGACADAPGRAVTLQPDAVRVMRAAELKRQLVDLHTELEDATLSAPVVKVVAGALLIVLAGVLGDIYRRTDATEIGGSGLAALVLGGALTIWGAVQLGSRLKARSVLPDEIRSREQELEALGRSP